MKEIAIILICILSVYQYEEYYLNDKIIYEIFKESVDSNCYNLWSSSPKNMILIEIYLDSSGKLIDVGRIEEIMGTNHSCIQPEHIYSKLKNTNYKFIPYTTNPDFSRSDIFKMNNNKVKYGYIIKSRAISFYEKINIPDSLLGNPPTLDKPSKD